MKEKNVFYVIGGLLIIAVIFAFIGDTVLQECYGRHHCGGTCYYAEFEDSVSECYDTYEDVVGNYPNSKVLKFRSTCTFFNPNTNETIVYCGDSDAGKSLEVVKK